MTPKEKEYISIKQGNQLSKNTIKEYEKLIKKIHDVFNKPVESVTFEEFTEYINTVENPHTKKGLIVFIKNYYKELEIEQGKFKKLRPKAIKINHSIYKKKLVSENDYNILINVAGTPRDKAIIELLYYTGFRLGELVSIKYDGVKIKENKIYVECMKSKTETRNIPVFDELIHTQNLINIFHETKNDNDFLFLTKFKGEYKQINPKNINAILSNLCKKAGISHHKPHDFRHTVASRLCKKGLPDNVIKKIMGWSDNSNMLSQYNHNQLKDYESIIQGETENKTAQQQKKENETLTAKVNKQEKEIRELKEMLSQVLRNQGNPQPQF